MTLKPDAHSDRTVLLYSGGIDSYCTAALTNPDVLLHVNLGGAYGEEETQALTTPKGMQHKLTSINMPDLAQFELPDHGYILPARNAFLALLGAQYGSTIYMASIAASRRARVAVGRSCSPRTEQHTASSLRLLLQREGAT